MYRLNKHQPFISIATPVYNGGNFIGSCIQSVIEQTYQNWEYVILDNKSTDDTLEIATSFSQKDNRIKVISNETQVSMIENFNKVLKLLSLDSTYCKIVHADDLLLPECIESMVNVGEKYPNVGLIGSYHYTNGCLSKGLDLLSYPTEVVSGKELVRHYMLNMPDVYYLTPPSLLLIRSSFMRDKDLFYEDHLATDLEASYYILSKSDYGFVHKPLVAIKCHKQQASAQIGADSLFYIGIIHAINNWGGFFLKEKDFMTIKARLWKLYYQNLAYNFFFPPRKKLLKVNFDELNKHKYNFYYRKFFYFLILQTLYFTSNMSKFRNCYKIFKGK
jgi:glycosyltransferase involved in cell wall biosynthesis